MGTYSRLLQNVAIRDARHNTFQYLVLGCLHGADPVSHSRYLGKKSHFPLKLLNILGGVDRLFAELWGSIPKLTQQELLQQAWISP